ncbi:MAG: hypothetical protein OEL54_05305 [Flavobacteriaceae bacterium]|nr:hypothetical protein [Flavobacteriaceae bacterium]
MKKYDFNYKIEIPCDYLDGKKIYGGCYNGQPWLESNRIFVAKMQLTGLYQIGKSIKAYYTDDSGNQYQMFLNDYLKIDSSRVDKKTKTISGDFCFRRCGNYYGVVLLDKEFYDSRV